MATKDFHYLSLTAIRRPEIKAFIENNRQNIIYSSLENEENEIEILNLFFENRSKFYSDLLFEIYSLKAPSDLFFKKLKSNISDVYVFLSAILCPISFSYSNFSEKDQCVFARFFLRENRRKKELREKILEWSHVYDFFAGDYNYEKLLVLSILVFEQANTKYFDELIKSIIDIESTNDNINSIILYIINKYTHQENVSIKTLSILKTIIETHLEFQFSDEYREVHKYIRQKIDQNFTIEFYLRELFSGQIQNIPNTENLFDNKHIDVLFKNRKAILGAYRKYLQQRNVENIRLVFVDLYNYVNLFFLHKDIKMIQEMNKLLTKSDLKDLIYRQITRGEFSGSKLLILMIQLEWYD